MLVDARGRVIGCGLHWIAVCRDGFVAMAVDRPRRLTPREMSLMSERPRTLRDLRESGYRSVGVKREMRRNLLNLLRRGETLFPGILGYDETVIPQVQHAILSQHDMLFLGLRGQGKTRMLRMLTTLLDEALPHCGRVRDS